MVDEGSLLDRLIGLQVGGCTCMTKTPELQYHKPECVYRIVSEAFHELVRLYQAEAQPSEPPEQHPRPVHQQHAPEGIASGGAGEGRGSATQEQIRDWYESLADAFRGEHTGNPQEPAAQQVEAAIRSTLARSRMLGTANTYYLKPGDIDQLVRDALTKEQKHD
jgi:hypothetical protein